MSKAPYQLRDIVVFMGDSNNAYLTTGRLHIFEKIGENTAIFIWENDELLKHYKQLCIKKEWEHIDTLQWVDDVANLNLDAILNQEIDKEQ